MNRLLIGLVLAGSVAFSAQTTVSPEALKHVEAARVAAGTEHAGVWKAA